MSSDEDAPKPESDYEVGYKRPPKSTRFRKGQSGNPKGRTKGARNFKTDLLNTLKAPVAITEGGKKRTVSTQQAMLMRLREKALKGDAKAIDRLVDLAQVHNIGEETKEPAPLAASDRAIIDRALARQMASAIASEPTQKGNPPDEKVIETPVTERAGAEQTGPAGEAIRDA